MKKLAIATILVVFLSSCSSFHQYTKHDLSSYDEQDFYDSSPKLYEYSAINVAVDSGISHGLGVPISPKYIATVAHVVDNLEVGQDVKIFKLGNAKQSEVGKLAYISPIDEIAVLEFPGGHGFDLPRLCENSFGGQRIHGSKPADIKNRITGGTSFIGLVTNVTEFPLVNEDMNKTTIKEAKINTKEMAGLKRLMIVVNARASSGNSGGAIVDIDNKCIVGLASMNARVSSFEAPNQLFKELGFTGQYNEGLAPNIMVGVSIVQYKKWMQ